MLLQQVSDQQIEALLEQLTDKSEKARINAAEELSSAFPEIGDPDRRMAVGTAVLKAMGDKSWPVRQAATLILPHISEAWAAEPLVNAFAEFDYPTVMYARKTEMCMAELGNALVRVGPPALEPMINFYMVHQGRFKLHETIYEDGFPSKIVHGYFEAIGDVASIRLISMISSEPDNDRVFHLLINCGQAAQGPLLEFIKKQGIPSPTFMFSDSNKVMVSYGLGAAALLGNKVGESYKNDLQARIDYAKDHWGVEVPKLENEYKALFHGKYPVSPALLALVVLRMQDCGHYQEALISILRELDLIAVNAVLPDLTGSMPGYAATLLGDLGNPAAIEPLAAALAMANTPGLRIPIIRALGKLGGTSVPGIILPYLKDADKEVRSATAETLGTLKDKQAVPALIETLNDNVWDTRLAAVIALGKIGDERAVPGLIERLSDKGGKFLGMGKGVREYAAEALKQIGTPQALEAIKGMKIK